tara:strand:- start:321 stop:878 length:558 start_codon:yes stop_codon:yes gene_type:complete
MAFKLNGKSLPIGVPFTVGTGEDAINYPANWLQLSTAEEKTAIGITEVTDPEIFDSRFYLSNGDAKPLNDFNTVDSDGNLVKNFDGTQAVTEGSKTSLKKAEKEIANDLLSLTDWYITRKAEKGTEIPTDITTYRDAVRTACNTRETEIDNCADAAALKTLYSSVEQSDGTLKPNMTQYPNTPAV